MTSEQAWAKVKYVPGDAVGIVGDRMVALLRSEVDSSLVTELTDVVRSSDRIEDAMEVLLGLGLRHVPDFVLAAREADAMRVIVRGNYVASCAGDEVPGEGLWAERRYSADAEIRLAVAGAMSTPELPLTGGVVFAAALTFNGSVNAEPLAAVENASVIAPVEPQPELEPQPEAEAEPMPTFEPEPMNEPEADVSAEPEPIVEPEVDPSDMPAVVLDSVDPDLSTETDASALNDDHTALGDSAVEDDNAPAWPARAMVEDAAEDVPAEVPMIDGLPWISPVEAAVVPEPVPSPAGPPAAMTMPMPADDVPQSSFINEPESLEDVVATVARPTPESRPQEFEQLVWGRYCPQGHLSPAQFNECWVCHSPIPPQDAVQTPRPRLGFLRFSDGRIVPLDRPVVMGRSPFRPDGAQEDPLLLSLDDPNKDVSKQHLEVGLDYWSVVIRDLGSTNGTEVTLPNQESIRLRPHEPFVIEPGTRLLLAGVVECFYEVAG